MNKYESVIIINSKIEDKEKVIEDYKKLLESFSNENVEVNIMGDKKLAYEIKKEKTGFYVVFNFVSEPEKISGLERKYRIDDNVLKFITIKTDEYVKDSSKVANVEKNRKNDKELER